MRLGAAQGKGHSKAPGMAGLPGRLRIEMLNVDFNMSVVVVCSLVVKARGKHGQFYTVLHKKEC